MHAPAAAPEDASLTVSAMPASDRPIRADRRIFTSFASGRKLHTRYRSVSSESCPTARDVGEFPEYFRGLASGIGAGPAVGLPTGLASMLAAGLALGLAGRAVAATGTPAVRFGRVRKEKVRIII